MVTVTLLTISLLSSMIMISVGASSRPKLYVDPSKVECWTPAFGDTFTINVSVANVTNLIAFDFELHWNTTQLDLVKIDIQQFLNPHTSIWINETHEDLGKYRLLMYSNGDPKNGSGALVKFTFKITHCEPIWPETVRSALDLAETKLYSPGTPWVLIDHDVYDGEYLCYSTPFLWITTMTDKPYYPLQGYGNITVYGNLTAGFSPVQDGLVALQVNNPRNQVFIIRTSPTGTPPASQIIQIINLYSCNSSGGPKNNFYRGTQGYFNITLRNNDTQKRRVLIAINLYDAENKPFGIAALEVPIAAGVTQYAILSFWIPSTAPVGKAICYANALTGWPKDRGAAYCPEKNATFNIINSTGGATASTPLTSLTGGNGNYSLTFKLPYGATAGIYRAYAGASYQGRSAMSSIAFGFNVIRVPGHYSTIQGAVDAATPTNNSILVLPGTYNEHVTINKNITLVGRDPRNTTISGTGTGTVVTVTTDNVEVSRFKIWNGGSSFPNSGIVLKNSRGSTLSENIILKNYYGIRIHSSDNNFILDNMLSRNTYGIYLNHSTGSTLRNNNMICNKYNFGVFGDSTSDFTHAIDTSNTVNRKPVIYWINKYDDEVPSNAGFVAIVSSTNITVRELELTKNVQGVLLAFTSNSVIERVNTLNNEYGIYLASSYGNTIIGSRVSNNSVGIYLRNSDENIIYHNNFINNVNQTERYQSSNTWDDGGIWLCPKCGQPQPKGNYWSDYTGLDNGISTQPHKCPGDGVGDTNLPHQGVDFYPLMNPWILVYDVAITNITRKIPYNAPHVYAGWKVTLNVTAKNKGDSIETFNVSVYANTTIIQTQTVTLPVRGSTIITLIWDTTDVAKKGNYTISANATIVPGETNKADNTYIDGMVMVTPAPDLNLDGVIDIEDIVIVAIAFESRPGYPDWNPIADINCDGIIDIADIVMVAIFFGWHERR